jgi:D-inositol-3-phosphate glycosyltransferase
MRSNPPIHGYAEDLQAAGKSSAVTSSASGPDIAVALLTGGRDKPYVFGLATALISKGATLDLIGSDYVDSPDFHGDPRVNFLNLRGDQSVNAGLTRKMSRVSKYYAKLIGYASTAKPKIFHILWNNKFETFDRTLLMLYYRILGKKIVLTAHNVNAAVRDSKDTLLNRFTLRIQYRLADHIFVHTDKMKLELREQFGVREDRVTIVPFGINNSIPDTGVTPSEARRRLGIRDDEKAILFFGNIAPYKGLEYLTTAFRQILSQRDNYRLIIAGWPKNCESYWTAIRETLREGVQNERVLVRAEYIPDEETEVYFKAADVLVLPYRFIFQSGVLFLAYSFGLPVVAADVGTLKDEIIEGKTGFVFRPEDSVDLASTIERYFDSGLFANLSNRRQEIRGFAMERHSWDTVGQMTMKVYADLLPISSRDKTTSRGTANATFVAKGPS